MFCNCVQRRCGKQRQNLIPQAAKSTQQIKKIAEGLGDLEILSKLQCQTVAYHQSCYAAYQTKKKQNTDGNTDSSWHKYRHIHKLAVESLKYFVTKEIIENSKVIYLAQLFLRYQALLLEFGVGEIELQDIQDYRQTFQKKLLIMFRNRITIEASSGLRGQKIVYKTDIDVSVMVKNTKFFEDKDEHKFEDVAYELRSCIKNIDSHPLPKCLNAEDIIKGECEIPPKLMDFMKNLIIGPNVHEEDSSQTSTKITSICSDINICGDQRKMQAGKKFNSWTGCQIYNQLSASYNNAKQIWPYNWIQLSRGTRN